MPRDPLNPSGGKGSSWENRIPSWIPEYSKVPVGPDRIQRWLILTSKAFFLTFIIRPALALPVWLYRNRWPFLFILTIGIGSTVGIRWGYRTIRTVQIKRLNSRAIDAMKRGNLLEARMCITTALLLPPPEPETVRLQVNLRKMEGNDLGALVCYQQLARNGRLTLGDLRPFANLAVSRQEWIMAEELARTADSVDPILGHLIRIDILLGKHRSEEARAELDKAIEASRKARQEKGDAARLELAQLMMRPEFRGDDASLPTSRSLALLSETGDHPTTAGAASLALGLQLGIVPQADRINWITRLRNHPNATPEMLLLADEASIQANPAKKDTVISELQKRTCSAPLDQRASAAKFLIHLHEAAVAQKLISREEALGSSRNFMLWMEIQKQNRHWDRILEALELESNPLPRHLRSLYRGASLKMLGRHREGEELFRRVLADYADKPEGTEVLNFLNAADEKELFEKGLREVLADPVRAENNLGAIIAASERLRDSGKMLRILELASSSPSLSGSLALCDRIAYLKLVLHQTLGSSEKVELEKRIESNPNEFSFRATRALDLIRSGRKAEALQVLDSIEAEVNASKLPPAQKMVLVLALKANGEDAKAANLLAITPTDLLSKQELELLSSSFTKSRIPRDQDALMSFDTKPAQDDSFSPSPPTPTQHRRERKR